MPQYKKSLYKRKPIQKGKKRPIRYGKTKRTVAKFKKVPYKIDLSKRKQVSKAPIIKARFPTPEQKASDASAVTQYSVMGKSFSANNTTASVFRNIMPNRGFTKLNWYHSTSVTPTTSWSLNQYRMNSIFDPDYTGVGHQPLGHDEFAYFYNRYRVLAAKIRVTFTPITANADILCGLGVHPGSGGALTWQTMHEDDRWKTCLAHGERGSRTMKIYSSLNSVIGITRREFAHDDLYQAFFGSNPSAVVYGTWYTQNVDEATSTTIRVQTKISYYVELSSRDQLPTS